LTEYFLRKHFEDFFFVHLFFFLTCMRGWAARNLVPCRKGRTPPMDQSVCCLLQDSTMSTEIVIILLTLEFGRYLNRQAHQPTPTSLLNQSPFCEPEVNTTISHASRKADQWRWQHCIFQYLEWRSIALKPWKTFLNLRWNLTILKLNKTQRKTWKFNKFIQLTSTLKRHNKIRERKT
jgi:hypothetical protein